MFNRNPTTFLSSTVIDGRQTEDMGNSHSSQHTVQMTCPIISPSPLVAMVNRANKSNNFHNISFHELDTIPCGEQIGRSVGQEHRQQEQPDVTVTRVQSLTDLLMNQSQNSCSMVQNCSNEPKYTGIHNIDIDTKCTALTNSDNRALSQNDIVDNMHLVKLQNPVSNCNIKNQKEKCYFSDQIDSCANFGRTSLEQSTPEFSMIQLSLDQSCFEEMTEADQGSDFMFKELTSNNDLVERGCSFGQNFCKVEHNEPTKGRLENSHRSDINHEYELSLNETLGIKAAETTCKSFVPSASKENHLDTQHDVYFQRQRVESDGLIEVGRHSIFMDAKTGRCYSVVSGSLNGDSPPIYNSPKVPHIHRFQSYSSDECNDSSETSPVSTTSPSEDLSICGGVFFRKDSELGSVDESNRSHSYEQEYEGGIFSKDCVAVKALHDKGFGQCRQSENHGDTFLQTYPGTSVFLHQHKVRLDRNLSCCECSPLASSLNSHGTECETCSAHSPSNTAKNGSFSRQLDSPYRNHLSERSLGVENRNGFSTDCTAACSECSRNMESSEISVNKSSSDNNAVKHTVKEAQNSREKDANRQNDNEGQRDAQSSNRRNREKKLALSDFYRHFEKNYVACLCCAEDVWDTFGLSFHRLLENWGFPIFCELRDLELTGPYYENIAKCLEERCNGKIIVVLSHSYVNSEECLFLTYFAKTLDPDSRSKNIIPVMIDKDVEIPNVLRGLAIIKYNYLYRCGWLKQKLITAIAA